ncbi:YaaC family protein [Paenactinomyces guangxiensis]|uniref:Uncharacterized protein n=1 Tax=Paenactinomyces guangxiensis TaxID=1490290 RepID=A0A7W1WQB6_9BACL|nr:YaaC family protein [Paenactinomyces guangxiensis]MBA4494123.1 hypothetical protein [Paenactinomyces guangxiensis]MBH8591132.1 hypothetical protein [Paenactinomyces guangxiensis]
MASHSVRFVQCESPEQYIWEEYLFYENERWARKFLKQKYDRLGVEHPDRAAFKNVQAFITYLKQAKAIFLSLRQNSLWVQPLLLYYGMMSLLKALVLTLDTNYPHSSSVLRHGLSTRKRKKEQFCFLKDEIRVQKEGLFPLAAKLLQNPVPAGESYTAQDLLGCIPELQSSCRRIFHAPTLIPVEFPTGEEEREKPGGMPFSLDESILDLLHLTPASFLERLNRPLPHPLFMLDMPEMWQGRLRLIWKHPRVPHVWKWEKGFDHPWFYDNNKGGYYLWIDNNRPAEPLSEILLHYMLLFSLSMLCRYEPPLWGELIHSPVSEDAVLVQQLLKLVPRKFPHLVLNQLREEKLIIHVH